MFTNIAFYISNIIIYDYILFYQRNSYIFPSATRQKTQPSGQAGLRRSRSGSQMDAKPWKR
jgi:hypothetical protein